MKVLEIRPLKNIFYSLLKSVIVLVLVYNSNKSYGQRLNNLSRVDRVISQIPDSLTYKADNIARYINQNLLTETEKSRAIYKWIANNIHYDYENLFAINFYLDNDALVHEVLKERKGVCIHFTELFSAIAQRVGLTVFSIHGYTKQNGLIDYVPHAWNIVEIDSSWYFFDATWGSGYIQNNSFIRESNNRYFMVKPDQFIRTHMPFDPLWKILHYPVTTEEFYEDKYQLRKGKRFFNYSDSLREFQLQKPIERYASAVARIRKNGIKNSMTYERIQYYNNQIRYLKDKEMTDQYNLAVVFYNEGVNLLHYYNTSQSIKADTQVGEANNSNLIQMANKCLVSSLEQLAKITDTDSNLMISIIQLNTSINNALGVVEEKGKEISKTDSNGRIR